jgi:hypothetical protein
MGVETSNKKTKPSDQSNMVIAIGKRKEDCGRLALSLQVSSKGRYYIVKRDEIMGFC